MFFLPGVVMECKLLSDANRSRQVCLAPFKCVWQRVAAALGRITKHDGLYFSSWAYGLSFTTLKAPKNCVFFVSLFLSLFDIYIRRRCTSPSPRGEEPTELLWSRFCQFIASMGQRWYVVRVYLWKRVSHNTYI